MPSAPANESPTCSTLVPTGAGRGAAGALTGPSAGGELSLGGALAGSLTGSVGDDGLGSAAALDGAWVLLGAAPKLGSAGLRGAAGPPCELAPEQPDPAAKARKNATLLNPDTRAM